MLNLLMELSIGYFQFKLFRMKYIAYYRVSTKQQGRSGLGLGAQKKTVQEYIKRNGNEILAEFTEVESGKNDNRPELLKAISMTKQVDAKLVIAKLDRLSRSAGFIHMLRDTGVNFVCADMPEANTLTIGMLATIAQYERELISERTKKALAVKKALGCKLGTPRNLTEKARRKGLKVRKQNALNNKANRHAYHFIKSLRQQGLTWEKIAEKLNEEGYRTRRGKEFHPWQCWNIHKRFEGEETNSIRN